jgi:hypothetical protein
VVCGLRARVCASVGAGRGARGRRACAGPRPAVPARRRRAGRPDTAPRAASPARGPPRGAGCQRQSGKVTPVPLALVALSWSLSTTMRSPGGASATAPETAFRAAPRPWRSLRSGFTCRSAAIRAATPGQAASKNAGAHCSSVWRTLARTAVGSASSRSANASWRAPHACAWSRARSRAAASVSGEGPPKWTRLLPLVHRYRPGCLPCSDHRPRRPRPNRPVGLPRRRHPALRRRRHPLTSSPRVGLAAG